ncbi:MAG TPA: hypothetical protein VI461_03030, partial [Chitinophagaceae bacterium]|nr:hypothetical protein [Chitinophagaceae bacterium]
NVQGKGVKISQQNNYPWEGDLKFVLEPKTSLKFSLMVRIPGWAQEMPIPSDLYAFEDTNWLMEPVGFIKKIVIKINGTPAEYTMENGYAVLNRTWKPNDIVEVSLPMDVRRVIAVDKLKEDAGKVALQRGPLIFCAEGQDNNGKASNIVLPRDASFSAEFKPDMLNGITVLKSDAIAVMVDEKGNKVNTVKQSFVAIPYYAWANRGKGEMTIWFPEKIKDIEILSH